MKPIHHAGAASADLIRYRPDIDGLRAVAVLPVLFYHLRAGPFIGGFIGVDVFFVISGYLIGRIILEGVASGTFSVRQFYVRRVLRIFPALFAMMGATAVMATALLMPVELIAFGKSLIFAALSVSNIHFWQTSDYFAQGVETAPLLHTWSLAVEEQFYVVIPLLVLLVHRRSSKAVGPILVVLVAASFAISIWSVSRFPEAAFYLLPSRLWELGIGVLLAHYTGDRPISRWQRESLAIAGLVAILASYFLISSKYPFPGLAAVPACLGTGAIILAGRSGPSLVSRGLSLRPVVFVGAISYSLYLWHWPIIIAQDTGLIFASGLSTKAEKALLIAVSLVAAWFSWRFIERPFRTMANTASAARVFGWASFAVLAAVGLGGGIVLSQGIPSRYPEHVVRTASFMRADLDTQFRRDRCFISSQRAAAFDAAECLGEDTRKPDLLIFGDSYAAHFYWGLQRSLPNLHLQQATAGGCPPVTAGGYPSCRAMKAMVPDSHIPARRSDGVWVAANWAETPIEEIFATVARLRRSGVAVVLIGPIPRYAKPLPRLLALADLRGDKSLPDRYLLPRLRELDRKMRARSVRDDVSYVSLFDTLCKGASCRTRDASGDPLRFDEGHLSAAGSIDLAPTLVAAMRHAIAEQSRRK